MSVSYNGKKIIPAPLVVLSKVYDRTDDTTKLGPRHSITLNGTIVAWKGSPNSEGVFWDDSGYPDDETIESDARQKAITSKQEALKDLFSLDYKLLEIAPLNGTAPIKTTPRVNSINFAEGTWVELCPYTVELEADIIYGAIIPSGEDTLPTYISSASESWSIESLEKGENEQQFQTYKLTHSVEAKGNPKYDVNGILLAEAWKNARNYVTPLLGLDTTKLGSGIINLPTYFSGLNHVRGQTIDELGGAYSVSESWIIASGTAIEDFSVELSTDTEVGLKRVNIQGSIEGLELRNDNYGISSSKYANALAKFATVEADMFVRAQNYASVQLNPAPLSKVIGKNSIAGTITYNAQFDNRPSQLIKDALGVECLSESINVTDQNQADIIASIFVIGRPGGPVLQDLNTVTAKERELSVEVVMNASGYNTFGAPALAGRPVYDPVITLVKPAGTVYTVADTESWDMKRARGNRTIRWIYE